MSRLVGLFLGWLFKVKNNEKTYLEKDIWKREVPDSGFYWLSAGHNHYWTEPILVYVLQKNNMHHLYLLTTGDEVVLESSQLATRELRWSPVTRPSIPVE